MHCYNFPKRVIHFIKDAVAVWFEENNKNCDYSITFASKSKVDLCYVTKLAELISIVW